MCDFFFAERALTVVENFNAVLAWRNVSVDSGVMNAQQSNLIVKALFFKSQSFSRVKYKIYTNE